MKQKQQTKNKHSGSARARSDQWTMDIQNRLKSTLEGKINRIETFIESSNEEIDSVKIKVKLRSLIQQQKNAEELRNNYYAIPNVKDAELTAEDEDLHLLEVCLESLEAIRKDGRLTSKTRIVFDAGSHQNNELSLNDCLWPGINLNPNLLDILINFRFNAIAFCSDIKQAFLQICLADEHKDAVRFLWSDDEPCVHKRPKLQVYRFNRVNFGVSSSPLKKENFNVHPVHETVSLGANGTKVLGLSWNTNEDYLTTDTKSLLEFVSLDIKIRKASYCKQLERSLTH
ncbi:uncharacterized protein TNCV_1164241 [Trichonephila clavipes]|nr:uncharacterized protein TNCV_1164241 [Trichonephila clavipes]